MRRNNTKDRYNQVKILPEIGIFVLLLSLGAMWLVCIFFESLLGQWGVIPALIGALYSKKYTIKLATYSTQKYEKL